MKFGNLVLMMISAAGLALASPLAAQEGDPVPVGRPLSLEDALSIAAGESEGIAIARAGVLRADSEVRRASSARLPQLDGSASYSRTLASQFQGIGGDVAGPIRPECEGDFSPNPGNALADRLSALETEIGCPAGFGGFDFDEIGFGSENTYNVGLSFFFPVFTGGRLNAQSRMAQSGRRAAEIGLTSAEAQLRLQATEAYFDAQLSDRLLAIAEATIEQLREALRLTELRAEAGSQAQFEVLRARVALMNQEPTVIQRRAQRDIAYERLRLMLELPESEPLVLTSELEEVAPREVVVDTAVMTRAIVQQVAEGMNAQAGQLSIARSQRLPSVSLTSQYGQVYFGGLAPKLNDFRDNWSVGAALQIPIFNGGRIQADVQAATAGLLEAEARLEEMVGLAILDTRNTISQLNAARAMWEASQGTVEQAQQAYAIAELRFAEGISTQLELTDARILLEQAVANRAMAARDLQVAQTRAELLPYLPPAIGGASATGAGAAAGGAGWTGSAAGAAAGGGAGMGRGSAAPQTQGAGARGAPNPAGAPGF